MKSVPKFVVGNFCPKCRNSFTYNLPARCPLCNTELVTPETFFELLKRKEREVAVIHVRGTIKRKKGILFKKDEYHTVRLTIKLFNNPIRSEIIEHEGLDWAASDAHKVSRREE